MILLAFDLDAMSLDCGGIEAIGKVASGTLLAVDETLRLYIVVEIPGVDGVEGGLEDVFKNKDCMIVLDSLLVEEDVLNEVVVVGDKEETLVDEAALVLFTI